MICAYDVFVRAGRAVRFASEVAGAAGAIWAISLSRRQEILAANASILARLLRFEAVVLALDLARKDALRIAALALQAFRAARGDYPDTLERLAEDGILARVPRDPFSGKPLRYGRIDATRYVLYSVGPNARDEGGEPMVAGAADRRGDFAVGVNTD